jgi:hypothetical protein
VASFRSAILNDYQCWTDRETILLIVPLNAGADSDRFTVDDCKRRAPTWKELRASNGAYAPTDLVFLVPAVKWDAANYANYAKPHPGFKVEIQDAEDDDPRTLNVMEVSYNTLRTWFRLVTRDLALHYDLRQSGTLYRPANTAGAAGTRIPGRAILADNLNCRVQELESAVETANEDLGGTVTRRRFVAYLEARLDVRAGDVLTVDAVDYEVTGSADFDQLDALGRVPCQRVE